MQRKPQLLLLDAGAVITAFACGGWITLCEHYDVIVPSIVIDEVQFYRDAEGQRVPIDLQGFVDDGAITCYEATAVELGATDGMLHPALLDRIHAGEREALTYIRVKGTERLGFVSGDGAAIEATVVFEAGHCATSLDAALRACGITKNLPHQHCDPFLKASLEEGNINLIQGRARSVEG